MRHIRMALLLPAAALLAGCSTITPYTMELAKEYPQLDSLSPSQAAGIVRDKGSVSGEVADYGTFLVDEEGFSYHKTTEGKRTEWRKGQPFEVRFTEELTRNVPWGAVTEISPYMEEYSVRWLGTRYRASLRYNLTVVEYGARTKKKEDLVLSCNTREDLVELLAALRVLTGK